MAVLSHRGAQQARVEPQAAFVLATATLLDDGIPYADLSVEQIARKAGRSRSTFYVHFRDKRELLLHATEEIAEQLYAAAATWLERPGEGTVRKALTAMLSTYREHPGLLSAVVEASGYDEGVRARWRELMERFVSATEHRLAADELGKGRTTSAEVRRTRASALVWMTERACYQQLTGGGVAGDEALVDALVDIWDRSAGSTVPLDRPDSTATEGENRSLSEEVSDALRDDIANNAMLSVVPSDRMAAITSLELDLIDWGYTYGVAWARARERREGSSDEALAREALGAAADAFRAYTGGANWTQGIEQIPARPAEGRRDGHARSASNPNPG